MMRPSEKQLAMLRRLAKRSKLKPAAYLAAVYDVTRPEDLTKEQASDAIDFLLLCERHAAEVEP